MTDPVRDAIARAIDRAVAEGRWDVVVALASQAQRLEPEPAGRAVSLDAERARRAR